ncbi:MAG TPA: hypothetical protein VJ949_05935 [Cryomorphaceae bacterium]|nr:hypothetical protein [Cryomorphaceae bacterium]
MIQRFLILIAFSSCLTSEAQERIDLFTISGRWAQPTAYDDFAGEAQESGLFANAKLPIVLSEKTVWFNNITYTQSRVQNDFDTEGISAPDLNLHAFILQTGLVQKLGKDRAIQLLFVPRYMTDFNNPSSGAWQFGAIGLYEKRYHEKLRLRYGFLFNQELAGPLLVPLVDVLWQFRPKWSLSGLFPIYGKLNYHATEKLTVGLSHFGLITSFDLGEESRGTYMERTSIDLSLFANYHLFGNFFAEGRIGYALDRNYEQYNEDEQIDLRISIFRIGDNRGTPLNATFADGLIASLRMVYSLPIPE